MQAHSYYGSYDLDCITKVKTIIQRGLGAVIWSEAATLPNRKRSERGGSNERNKSCQNELMQRWSQKCQEVQIKCSYECPKCVCQQTAQIRFWTESSGFCWKHPETQRLDIVWKKGFWLGCLEWALKITHLTKAHVNAIQMFFWNWKTVL